MITALVLFKVERGKTPRLANQLGAIQEVVEVLSITGEYDLMAKIQVREYENLSDIVTEKMQNTDGVLETRTMMAFKTYKFPELATGAPNVELGPPAAETAATLHPGRHRRRHARLQRPGDPQHLRRGRPRSTPRLPGAQQCRHPLRQR
jgi:anthranilate phosphoribosyltransferase